MRLPHSISLRLGKDLQDLPLLMSLLSAYSLQAFASSAYHPADLRPTEVAVLLGGSKVRPGDCWASERDLHNLDIDCR